MTRATVVAALAGALIALVVAGGFLALDRTVLHWTVLDWYVESDESAPSVAENTDALQCQGALEYRAAVATNPPTLPFRGRASGPPTFGPNRNLGPLIAITDQDLLIKMLKDAQELVDHWC